MYKLYNIVIVLLYAVSSIRGRRIIEKRQIERPETSYMPMCIESESGGWKSAVVHTPNRASDYSDTDEEYNEVCIPDVPRLPDINVQINDNSSPQDREEGTPNREDTQGSRPSYEYVPLHNVSPAPQDHHFDACAPYNPPIPNFKEIGRRISDIKYQEYIWNVKVMAERKRRETLCNWQKFQQTGSSAFGPTTPGGRETMPGEFPHMGAVGWLSVTGSWVFKCGSSLISPKFVLTAAHCTSAPAIDTKLADHIPRIIRLSHKNIIYGLPQKTLGKYDVNILNIIPHPNYTSPMKYFDIALMELEHEVGFNQLVQPACLWSHSDVNRLGQHATMTGWGVPTHGSLDISPELHAAVLDIIDTDHCNSLLEKRYNRHWCGLEEHQLCAGVLAGGIDACQGDSGGPLQIRIPLIMDTPYNMYYIVGVTSFGIGCAKQNLPGVYTRVSSFVDWIERIVWPQ